MAPYLGIILVAFGLLSALTSYSPLAGSISTDIGLSDVSYGLLGTIGPFTFAFMGLITPIVARKLTLEWTILLAAAFIGLGQILRAFAGETAGFFVFSIVAMLGIAAGNLLLPPLIKRFFPDRAVSVSTVYSMLMVTSSIYPPLLAVPIAELVGWRFSIGVWGIIELVAVVPWLVTIFTKKKDAVAEQAPASHKGLGRKVWSHPTSWAMLVGYAVGTFNFYIIVAWLPVMLDETAGFDPAAAGALLSLYSAIGILTAFVVPNLVAKLANIGLLFIGTAAFMVAGYLGLWLAPGAATWLWVALAGVGPTFFLITLVATNFRTTSEIGAVTLTGMMTFGGYLIGGFGPLVVGFMRASGASWDAVIIMLIVSSLFAFAASLGLRKRRYVDE